jgi:micrococcal nuclease
MGTIIPPGTELTLTYERDELGRTVAQAMTRDGRLVNAEIVRAGLATVVNDASAPHAAPAIEAAAREALDNKRGMHAPDIACTVPGQVKTLTEQVSSISAGPQPAGDVAAIEAAADRATNAWMAAEVLDAAFTQNHQEVAWAVLGPTERSQLQTQVETARGQAAAAETALRGTTNISINQDATQAATQKEASRITKALAAIQKAEARRATVAARREQAARKAQADAAAELHARADTHHTSHNGSGRSSEKRGSGISSGS